jgi:hypothetical protein
LLSCSESLDFLLHIGDPVESHFRVFSSATIKCVSTFVLIVEGLELAARINCRLNDGLNSGLFGEEKSRMQRLLGSRTQEMACRGVIEGPSLPPAAAVGCHFVLSLWQRSRSYCSFASWFSLAVHFAGPLHPLLGALGMIYCCNC